MDADTEFKRLDDTGKELLGIVEDERWEEAITLSQQWDQDIRNLLHSLSNEQFSMMRYRVEDVALQNTEIKKQLETLRAKVLTQIQETTTSRKALQTYDNINR